MKKTLTSLFIALAWSLCSYAQDIPEPLLGVTFDKSGLVLSGTDAANHTGKAYNTYNTHNLYDPIKDRYYGATNYDATGFYYVMYDADDALGKAFGKEVTWELLVRLDNQKAQASTSNTSKKILSSQESGGWSIIHTPGTGIRLEYVTTDNNINTIKASKDNIVTGKFYHIVVTVNKTANLASIYVNGEQLATDVAISADDFIFGNFGSPRRLKNMWFCIGGDNGATNTPNSCQLSTRGTFVFANIYGKALSSSDVAELYDDEDIKYYTEPTRPAPGNPLILDAVFGKDGTARDLSPYAAEIGKTKKPLTQYNAGQKRYEATCSEGTPFNFFHRDYFYDPSITSQLGDAFSFEIYSQNCGTYTDHQCPLTNQQDGGFGLEVYKTTGYPYFICNTFGYHAGDAKVAAGKGTVAGSTEIGTDYRHVVGVYDRLAKKTKLYVDGTLVNSAYMDAGDNLCFPFAGYEWFGIMADTRANITHDNNDYPFAGNMSIARVWGKALADSDVAELYAQAKATSLDFTIDANGYAALCLPFAATIPAGMKAYAVIGKTASGVTLAQLAGAGEAVAYGTPFFIKGTPGDYTIHAADISTQETHTATGNLLEGSFIPTDANAYEFQSTGTSLTHSPSAGFPAATAFLPYKQGDPETLAIVISDSIIPLPEDISIKGDTVTGDNISGHITCNGAGVKGVKVSDGFVVVKTDKNGFYSFRSEKKNGYVFYTIPSGYMPDVDPALPEDQKIFVPFWQAVTSASPNTAEVHDFKLRVENNEEFYFLAGADSHLANRNNDLVQFSKGFIERLKEEKAIAEEASVPIYSTILGDNAWDSYWYGNNYNLKNYRATLAEYGYALPFFPCMGNHDNDGATPCDENTDFEASAPFRKIMAPNYYSFNIGKVHFVILDDIFYINSGDPSGTACVGSRNYKGHIPGYELEWLRKDLQDVDHDTPVILGMHIPVWMRHTSVLDSCYAYLTYNEYNSSVDLAEILSDYSKVHIITGHTHWNHHAHPAGYPNIHENNIAAVCAIWWYTGNKTGWHNCRDGVPGGYEMFHINGKDITWKYHSIEKNGNAQFHVLDINTVKQSYQNNENKVINLIEKYPSYSYTDFRTWEDNQLLVNVFSFDNDWKVEATENGIPLSPTRLYIEDPYHMLTYDIVWNKDGSSIGKDARATKNTHMFAIQCNTATAPVTIRVTDSFGEVYEQVVQRPVAFSLDAINTETNIVTNIRKARTVATDNAEIHSGYGCVKINVSQTTTARIVSLNGGSRVVRLSAGDNEIPVTKRGIYIVSLNGQAKKVFVR